MANEESLAHLQVPSYCIHLPCYYCVSFSLMSLPSPTTPLPGSQPGAHTSRSMFALTPHKMQYLPGRIFNVSLSLSLPSRCSSSQSFISLQVLMWLQPGDWQAPPRPALWLSIQQAFRIPETGTASACQLDIFLMPGQWAFPNSGRVMERCTPGHEQAGCSLPGQQDSS